MTLALTAAALEDAIEKDLATAGVSMPKSMRTIATLTALRPLLVEIEAAAQAQAIDARDSAVKCVAEAEVEAFNRGRSEVLARVRQLPSPIRPRQEQASGFRCDWCGVIGVIWQQGGPYTTEPRHPMTPGRGVCLWADAIADGKD